MYVNCNQCPIPVPVPRPGLVGIRCTSKIGSSQWSIAIAIHSCYNKAQAPWPTRPDLFNIHGAPAPHV